jgi:hypothetical protein
MRLPQQGHFWLFWKNLQCLLWVSQNTLRSSSSVAAACMPSGLAKVG